MAAYPSQEIEWTTPRGRVRIGSFFSADRIRRLRFDSQFGSHAHFKSLYTRRESLERNAESPEANVTLALAEGGHIIGFGVLVPPEPEERWAKMGGNLAMEVKAIEVCRDWRSHGISREIIRMLIAHPRIEEKIAYMVGYSWTWDLEGTGLSAQAYRTMLVRIFEPFGFRELPTNEPNVCLKPENVFMGRVGSRVSGEARERFKWLRFGLDP